ncbi:hypothetical protein [uncultured Duncaniella sp.]|uniref:hypothetical protein n=1 Tax=uncultured Duncaniella sp. TaxID=2768039 RepID=UPI00262B3BAC|nr:hypothetical protein [uncultured Duncaniella sp.]
MWRIVHLPHASLPDTSFDLRSSLASVRSWWGYQRIAAAQLSGCRADLSARGGAISASLLRSFPVAMRIISMEILIGGVSSVGA